MILNTHFYHFTDATRVILSQLECAFRSELGQKGVVPATAAKRFDAQCQKSIGFSGMVSAAKGLEGRGCGQ